MKSVEIPGGTAQLREASEIRQRDRKRVVSAGLAAASAMGKIERQKLTKDELEALDIAELGLTFDEAESFQVLQKAMIIASLIGWSLDQPVPTWETIEDVPAPVYKALSEATTGELNTVLSGVDFEPVDPGSPGFEESPTGRSDGSKAGSSADQESESIEAQSNGGLSTDTGARSPA